VRRQSYTVAGIDLAGVSHRPSGCCLLDGLKADTKLLYTDEEILDWVRKEKPELIAIDAPLTLPPGRKSIDERNESHYRPCDMELRRRKIPFFPITLGPMRVLTKRGIKLREVLERARFRVVEIYPGGAQDIWGIPRARHDLSGLRDGLRKRGITGLKKQCTDHELDAASGALVGHLFLQEKAEVYGDFESGAIIMPPQS
jgi:predicted nuclease with RNAse H fold